jgi:hypothetical protein
MKEHDMDARQRRMEMNEAMKHARALEPSSIVANPLLDTVKQRMELKTDAELSRVLEVAAPIISKIRHAKLTVGASILLRIHEKSDISIRELKALAQPPSH